ncbi:hypothetical protein SPLC1_S320180 [Arthrospira platensis C1]|nr:hypothetical protein SPLC1_S320180 [Arthrospira platensis C1]
MYKFKKNFMIRRWQCGYIENKNRISESIETRRIDS